MTEEWKPINKYDGAYYVSNLGNVKSIDRNVLQLNCHGGYSYRKDKGKMLTQIDNGNGYLKVNIRYKGNRKSEFVHRLVAEAFCEKHSADDVVNHIDFNTHNNASINLEWCTQKQNINHSIKNLHKQKNIKTNTGEKYITKKNGNHASKSKPFYVSVKGRNKVYYKNFDSLDEAVLWRNEVLENEKHIS